MIKIFTAVTTGVKVTERITDTSHPQKSASLCREVLCLFLKIQNEGFEVGTFFQSVCARVLGLHRAVDEAPAEEISGREEP